MGGREPTRGSLRRKRNGVAVRLSDGSPARSPSDYSTATLGLEYGMGTGFRAVAFELEGLEFVLFELEPKPVARSELSEAEHAVAALVVRGHSTSSIARERGVSCHTVANQLDAIYRKLDVHSRGELSALLRGDHDVGGTVSVKKSLPCRR